MQLGSSKVWIWRGVGQSDGCYSIWWLLHEVRLLGWWQSAVEFVTSSLSLSLCVCVCVHGGGWEAISRQTLYSLSVLQCIERTGLVNSCKSSRVLPAVGVRCKSVTLGTKAHFNDRVAWMCE